MGSYLSSGSTTPPYDSGVDSTQASTPTNKSAQQHQQPLKSVRQPPPPQGVTNPQSDPSSSVDQTVHPVHPKSELQSGLQMSLQPMPDHLSNLPEPGEAAGLRRVRERKRSTEDIEGAISLASLGRTANLPPSAGCQVHQSAGAAAGVSVTQYTVTSPVADHASFAQEVLRDTSAPQINLGGGRQMQAPQPTQPTTLPHPHLVRQETVIRQPAGHFISVTGSGYY